MTGTLEQQIVDRLKAEALDHPKTGWLSDLATHGLSWDEDNQAIDVEGGPVFGIGSVDVGQIAGIVADIAASLGLGGESDGE